MPNTNKEKTWGERFTLLMSKYSSSIDYWHNLWESDAPRKELNIVEDLISARKEDIKTFISTLLKEQEEKHQGMVEEFKNIQASEPIKEAKELDGESAFTAGQFNMLIKIQLIIDKYIK